MKLTTSKGLPSIAELKDILRQEFSSDYSYRLFGLGKEKTLIVGKSPLVGAQISIHENEVTIQPTPPTLPAAFFVSFVSMTEFVVLLLLFVGIKLKSPWKEFERDISKFLYKKYN
ncbi:hypothetical protein [Chryseosolibacter indicus]|uniref:Uncharacterized protein n=1 Tax=Chryseosolibacter indicus TaxID=2782351 RepID=A0ABS5VXZ1_9BACT|nr:hypothetical protein [Chryseosolibacter indicus]MBT1705794.1 hypothetical protein [Chryseosolibacter indicus]